MLMQVLWVKIQLITSLNIFVYFSQENKSFDILCKLLICMQCQSLCSGKNKKKIFGLLSAEFAQRVVKINAHIKG